MLLHLQATLLGFVLPAFPEPWYGGRMVGLLKDLEAVAFFVAWLARDQQLELNPSKRQRPMAWVTAHH